MEHSKQNLYLVVLGGKAPEANIELHDVRWVIGSKIEDTYDYLRESWFGSLEDLHIDSYKKIDTVDGFKINLKKRDIKNKELNKCKKIEDFVNRLWFVNLGAYDPLSMQEKHEFGLLVAKNSKEAKNKAKSRWLKGYQKRHKDDIAKLEIISDVDNCLLLKNIGDWEIELIIQKHNIKESKAPDWFGYLKLDN
mgnify:FL=1